MNRWGFSGGSRPLWGFNKKEGLLEQKTCSKFWKVRMTHKPSAPSVPLIENKQRKFSVKHLVILVVFMIDQRASNMKSQSLDPRSSVQSSLHDWRE